MLPFFRKIRWRLAANNQFFKYSRYAIGEIVLVVIGILIALYINNWNEQRKEREKFDQVLMEVEKELIDNINNARAALSFYQTKDSLVNLILFDTLSIADYKNNIGLMYVLRGIEGLTILDESFKKLMQVPAKHSDQDSIIDELKTLYGDPKWGVDTFDNERNKFFFEILSTYKKYPWYVDWIGYNRGNEEMYNYFANNPVFKADVMHYSTIALNSHRNQIERFELESRRAYNSVSTYLEKRVIREHDSLFFTYRAQDYSHYVGTYQTNIKDRSHLNLGDSTVIEIADGRLFLTPYYSNGTNTRREVIPVSKYSFRTETLTGYWRLVFNDEGEVIGCNFSSGNWHARFQKIN